MDNEELKIRGKKLQNLVKFLNDCVGSRIKIEEHLSILGNFDRHNTSYNHFTMILGQVRVRFSGGMIMLDGVDENDGTNKTDDGILIYCPQAAYEISAMNIKEVPVPDNKIVISESYPGTVVRRTTITGLIRKDADK